MSPKERILIYTIKAKDLAHIAYNRSNESKVFQCVLELILTRCIDKAQQGDFHVSLDFNKIRNEAIPNIPNNNMWSSIMRKICSELTQRDFVVTYNTTENYIYIDWSLSKCQ